MATAWISYICPLDDCTEEHQVEADIEPADPNYGADADGNRGMYMSAYVIPPGTPFKCPYGHGDYDEEQRQEITRQLERNAESWEAPDRSDDYYDDER